MAALQARRRDELADRARRGVGGIREERHRLLWDNLPIWFWVRPLATLLAERVPLSEVAALAAGAERAVPISSTCTVFAESEVISLVAAGEPLAGIVRGLHRSLASRMAALARGPGTAKAEVFLSGGVTLNAAMVSALEE
jgi:hypothetical protein